MGLLFGTAGMFAQDVNYGDFENGLVGIWENWGGTHTVENNPNTTNAINTSSKVIKYVPAANYQAVKIWKSGVISGNYASIEVDVYAETAGDIQIYFDNSVSAPTAAAYTAAKTLTAGAWQHLSFDLSSVPLKDYQQMAFQNMYVGVLYFDNVTLKASSSTETIQNAVSQASIFAAAGTINVTNAEGSKIEIYSMTGSCVSSTDKASAEFTANVNAGIYMVIVDGISTKVIVK